MNESVSIVATAALLWALAAPLPASATICADVECGDVDASGKIVASDAMRLLRRAVGHDVDLACPLACLDTTTTTTTTTTLPSLDCAITFRVTDDVVLTALQFDIDYSAAVGEFAGEGVGVACTDLTPLLGATYDNDDARLLTVLLAPTDDTIAGPLNVVTCEFEGPLPTATDFEAIFRDALREDETVSGNGGTGVCAAPGAGLLGPTIRDYIHIIRAAAGQVECPLCECDADGSGLITASDGLMARQAAGGLPVELYCPVCGYPPSEGTIGDPVSIEISVGCF